MGSNLKYIIAVVLLCLGFAARAQTPVQVYRGQITVRPHELSQRGDSLYIYLTIDQRGVNVASRRTLDLIPVISAGDKSVELPMLTIAGNNQYKSYKRSQKLSGEQMFNHRRYAVLPTGNQDLIHYRYTLPYQAWMETAVLDLKQDLCGCGAYIQQLTVERLANNINLERTVVVEKEKEEVVVEKKVILIPYQMNPSLAYVQPKTEELKQREMTGEARLSFEVSKAIIRPELGNNTAELVKIRELIESVDKDKYVSIRRIHIAGYASPEGSLAMNQRLSEARATALRNYLTGYYGISPLLYSVHFGGEDWDGLLRLIEASQMPYKQEMMSLILFTSIEGGRKAKMMRFARGMPYRYMLDVMYPGLRRVLLTIEYDVKNFSIAEAKEVFQTRPYNLSLNEMFLLANTYVKGSEEFNEVFETAVRIFPNDETANLNAAASALGRNNLPAAEKYLSKVGTPSGEYLNNMGVLLMLQGDYDRAEGYLQRANTQRIPQAQDNLVEMAKKIENIRQMENETK